MSRRNLAEWRSGVADARMRGGFLHLTCLSKRLGRPLTKADFTNAHVNSILTAIP